ncbi:MAG TPA: M3 family metallopeptidase [Polyangiaceae bacterium]|nr:M3 family metallopeptidase [Polyangiaceae bacterium]
MATSRPADLANNPFLDLRDPIPFDRMRAEALGPAVDWVVAEGRAAIERIANDPSPPTYASTLGALEEATRDLERTSLVAEHLETAATTPELRAAWTEAQPKISAFFSELPLHAGLYARLSAFAKTDEAQKLEPVFARHLDKVLAEFKRHGAELSPEGKKQLTEIDVELTKITTRFSQNVLDATNAFELVVEDEAQVAGLPDLAKRAARESAAKKGKAGYRFTLHAPSFIPAVTHLDDAGLRERLYRAYNERCSGGDHDNRALLGQILDLRKKKAALLGFGDFGDFTTVDRMAKSGARARSFIADLRARTEPFFARERAALVEFAGRPLSAWDVAYFSEKQRKALFDFDDEALRPYFPLDGVLSGVFQILGKLYGVRFEPVSVPTWDASVRPYHLVGGDGTHLATVYVDLFPRENKVQGAWMAPLFTATPPAAHVAVVAANFTPPLGDTPALLTHREVETLFHELGHLMHQCLSRVPVRRLAGTSVAWDFVELPSQIMENWTWERGAVDLFARHYQTGERIPDALFDKLVRARTYRAASAQMQQLGYAEVDLDLHTTFDAGGPQDAVARARAILAHHVTAPLPDEFAMIASFGHLFANPVGYAAGYYSYKWAEVLDADAFGRFREEGLFSPEVGAAFRDRLLARGDSADPEELFRDFRGRDPSPDALLERQGLLGRPH